MLIELSDKEVRFISNKRVWKARKLMWWSWGSLVLVGGLLLFLNWVRIRAGYLGCDTCVNPMFWLTIGLLVIWLIVWLIISTKIERRAFRELMGE